ncbi:MAG: DUF2523 family protein [Pseudoxanthomonas sp.]
MTFWEKLTSTLTGFAPHLIGAMKLAASFIVARVLAALGLSFVLYKSTLPVVKTFLQGYFDMLPEQVLDLAGALGVDIFMVMILSALVTKVGTRVFLTATSALQEMVNNAGG